MTTKLHPDLIWLAEHEQEWQQNQHKFTLIYKHGGLLRAGYCQKGSPAHKFQECFTREQWESARQQLGLAGTYQSRRLSDASPAERDEASKPALQTQIAGGHYKDLAIQPVEYIHKNGLGFCEGSVVKYITRWREKGGLSDLKKAKHFIDLLIELEGLSEPG